MSMELCIWVRTSSTFVHWAALHYSPLLRTLQIKFHFAAQLVCFQGENSRVSAYNISVISSTVIGPNDATGLG